MILWWSSLEFHNQRTRQRQWKYKRKIRLFGATGWKRMGHRFPRPTAIMPAWCARALPCGAMGTSRPTAITHAWCARALPGRRDGCPSGLPTRALPPLRTRNSPVAARHRALPPLRSREVRPNCACHNTCITRALYIRTPSETLNRQRCGTCAKRGLCRQDSMERKKTASG